MSHDNNEGGVVVRLRPVAHGTDERDTVEGFAEFVTRMAQSTKRELDRRRAEVEDKRFTEVATEGLFGLVACEAKWEVFIRAAMAVADGDEAAGRSRLTTDLLDIITDCARSDDPFAHGVSIARREAALDIILSHPGLELDSRQVLAALRDRTGATRRRPFPGRTSKIDPDE